MNKCKQLFCLLLVVSSLFTLFSVNVHASDDENLIDKNLSNWIDLGETSPNYFQSANVSSYDGFNYIEVAPSDKAVYLLDLTEFLKVGESYEFSFGLPLTDGVNSNSLNSCTIGFALVDGGGYTDIPAIGASVFEILIDNSNKSKYLGKTTTYEFTYTQGYKNTCLVLVIEPGENVSAYNYLQLYISDLSIKRIVTEEESLLSSIIEWLKEIKDKLVNGFDNLKNGLIELKNNIIELPQKIGAYIKNLFIPSDDYFTNKMDEMQTELEAHLGAVYQVTSILDDFFTSFNADVTRSEIEVPLITVDLLGYPFSFGGWTVPLIPDSRLEFMADASKFIFGVLTTFALLYGLRKKYDEIVGGGED